MLHVVAKSHAETRLFSNWPEGLLLWRKIFARVSVRAIVIMSTHLHVLVKSESEKELLVRALVAYAQARNARREVLGAVWSPGVSSERLSGKQHVQRLVRYLHLNPCRARLVKDPLAWPLSTHRDAVGLAISPVITPARDPESHHAWVSKDKSCDPDGTPLPQVDSASQDAPSLAAVRAAVSALARVTPSELRSRGRARTLLVRAARALGAASDAEIAAACELSERTVRRIEPRADRETALIARVAGDPRFALLHEGEICWD